MPKKSRKSKIRERSRREGTTITSIQEEVAPRVQLPPVAVPAARRPVQRVAEIQPSEHHEYVLLDLKRSVIVGGLVLTLLIVVSLLLR